MILFSELPFSHLSLNSNTVILGNTHGTWFPSFQGAQVSVKSCANYRNGTKNRTSYESAQIWANTKESRRKFTFNEHLVFKKKQKQEIINMEMYMNFSNSFSLPKRILKLPVQFIFFLLKNIDYFFSESDLVNLHKGLRRWKKKRKKISHRGRVENFLWEMLRSPLWVPVHEWSSRKGKKILVSVGKIFLLHSTGTEWIDKNSE